MLDKLDALGSSPGRATIFSSPVTFQVDQGGQKTVSLDLRPGHYRGQKHRHFISNGLTLLQLPTYVQCVSSVSYVTMMVHKGKQMC